MPPRLPSILAACAILAACSASARSGDDGPRQSVRVAFVPVDLTTGLAATSAPSVVLTHQNDSGHDPATLTSAVTLETLAGAPLGATAMVDAAAADELQRIDVTPVDPLPDGWHVVRFDTAVLRHQHFVQDGEGVELLGGIVAGRFRVGSQPFVRSARVCGTFGGERPAVVELDFTEPVHSTDGTPIAIQQNGATVCTEPLDTAAAELRSYCGGIDPAAEIIVALPPLESASGVPLVRGPDDGPVPPTYTITPDARAAVDTECVRYPLVPGDALAPVALD